MRKSSRPGTVCTQCREAADRHGKGWKRLYQRNSTDPDWQADFLKKIDRSAGPEACWPWTAGRFPFGHGCFWIDGKSKKASRLAYEIEHGPIPPGLCVLHSCDNPPCCNPAHLRAGTQADNCRDKVLRSRQIRGTATNTAKLDEDTVRSIRSLARYSGIPVYQIAKLFGVSNPNVRALIHRRSWRDVSEISP